MQDKIKVLIADDMPQIRDYFSMIVANELQMEVAGTAASGAEAVKTALALNPDVILMDIQMETDTAGIEATKKIKAELPNVRVIMLTIHDDDGNIMDSYVAGADDYVVKTASVVEVITAIRDAVEDTGARTLASKKVVDEMVRLRTERESLIYVVNLITRLTHSELEVLKMVYDGNSYRQIAQMRHVEEATIRSLINKILKKTDSKSMKELVGSLKKLNIMEYIGN